MKSPNLVKERTETLYWDTERQQWVSSGIVHEEIWEKLPGAGAEQLERLIPEKVRHRRARQAAAPAATAERMEFARRRGEKLRRFAGEHPRLAAHQLLQKLAEANHFKLAVLLGKRDFDRLVAEARKRRGELTGEFLTLRTLQKDLRAK